MNHRVVTITTDFGISDSYVAQVKGVILSAISDVTLVDVTHQIPPQDITRAAFIVSSFVKYYPENSIHLAVVDPGVGEGQKLLIETEEGTIFVGPDNGIFTLALQNAKIKNIINIDAKCDDMSMTFHGRDVYAKIIAEILKGKQVSQSGNKIDDYYRLNYTKVTLGDHVIKGKVIYVDRFGNLITNISPANFKEVSPQNSKELEICIADKMIPKISRYYSEALEGTLVAVWNSYGLLEIAVNKGSAFNLLNDEETEQNAQAYSLPLKVKVFFK